MGLSWRRMRAGMVLVCGGAVALDADLIKARRLFADASVKGGAVPNSVVEIFGGTL